ncbi:hypothetical protein LTR36_002507 [Oleoguttula mirabilis]|uniref:Cytochrome P450 n=1 Tax=Oleoguttula mirabilis TaxID=1507867 RepID=A0AAV9JLU6_9PEZI|nr:hypothetical protein LTR36_002507 [Oleoguttula mirabilis]
MPLPIIPTLALALVICLAVYRYVIHPAYISPLSKIPAAHWSAPFSGLWILYHRSREEETPTVHAAHQRLGPIVRLAPNDISINSVDGGIRTVYAGGHAKGDWYRNVFSNYGVMPMFAMPDNGVHSKRKRMLSNIYAKTTLQASPALDAISKALLDDLMIPRLHELSKGGEAPVEFYDVFAAVTHDFVSAYIFGLKNGSHLLQEPDMNQKFFRDYKARQRFQFWPQDLPMFTAFLKTIGLKWMIVPKWVDKANADIEAWILKMGDDAEATLKQIAEEQHKGKPEDYPTVYAQLRNALLKESRAKSDADVSTEQLVQQQRLEVASEMLDHTLAGFDTSSITLTFFAWELSRAENRGWQDELRAELLTLADKRDAKAVDALPVLHATVMETLRLHAAIPGNQPRVTPPAVTLGAPGHDISDLPAGLRVQAQAWSLHRDPTVFPNPDRWHPGRWLDATEAQHKEMSRWFWAFGSGGRMCVGSNLAMYDMKAIITAIWSTFSTEVVFDEGMVHRGGYVAEPIGKDDKYLMLEVRELL